MKKAMWIISCFALVLGVTALQFLPERVPMHYNIAGEIDRWGSKLETLLFPVVTMLLSLVFHFTIASFEKKAANAAAEKERAEAQSNIKVLKIVGVSMAAIQTVLQGVLLYTAYKSTPESSASAPISVGRISCLLCGVLFIIIGNFMPKTKRNALLGFRVRWSMYNDVTWAKTNRFSSAALVVAGLASILTAALIKTEAAAILLPVYTLIALLASLVYAYKVYRRERLSDLG